MLKGDNAIKACKLMCVTPSFAKHFVIDITYAEAFEKLCQKNEIIIAEKMAIYEEENNAE